MYGSPKAYQKRMLPNPDLHRPGFFSARRASRVIKTPTLLSGYEVVLCTLGHSRLYVWNVQALGLPESILGANVKRAEDSISERQYDIEIPAMPMMMEQMMTVEPNKDPAHTGYLEGQPLRSRQMHAPVPVFVYAIIGREYRHIHDDHRPIPRDEGVDKRRNAEECNEHWSIPPGHWNCFFVLFILKMIGLIRTEDVMMDLGMRFVRIRETEKWSVHDKLMQPPFGKRR